MHRSVMEKRFLIFPEGGVEEIVEGGRGGRWSVFQVDSFRFKIFSRVLVYWGNKYNCV